jgi:FAD/FMN-containing dehydrogenase
LRVLNGHGLSLPSLQSYASFNVAGSLAVNVHGIASDRVLCESVVSLLAVLPDGSAHRVSRSTHADLFGALIGGMGMFGVVWEVQLRTVRNVPLRLDTVHLEVGEIPGVYEGLLDDTSVNVKLARIDITSWRTTDVYVARAVADSPTVSPLSLEPRRMSLITRLAYKWLAATAAEARFAYEHATGTALDWSVDARYERNSLVYEDAEPLGRLMDPMIVLDDTFILQEYFVPRDEVTEWLSAAGAVAAGHREYEDVRLLNCTMRVVEANDECLLSYAAAPGGSFAFVLYYRAHRTPEADEHLRLIHEEWTALTLRLGGTFYLPYRPHYTQAEIAAAYPRWQEFWAKKDEVDPGDVFTSRWSDRYRPTRRGDGGKAAEVAAVAATPTPAARFALQQHLWAALAVHDEEEEAADEPCPVSTRRPGALRTIFADPTSCSRFRDLFLTRVLSVAPPQKVWSAVARVCWNRSLRTDAQVYQSLKDQLDADAEGTVGSLTKGYRSVSQLSSQKRQLARQLESILARLAVPRSAIASYAAVGDPGTLVQSVLTLCPRVRLDRVWIAHDRDSADLPARLERGSLESPGTFVLLRLEHPRLRLIPTASIHLLTMNQGLHHIPQPQLLAFLREVERVLAPGGIFLTREHDVAAAADARNDRPTHEELDVAHILFNAATGVPMATEEAELRGFRSMAEWRAIIRSVGLLDTSLAERQTDDPTWDFMMAFVKPGTLPVPTDGGRGGDGEKERPETPDPLVIPAVSQLTAEMPRFTMVAMHGVLSLLMRQMPKLRGAVDRLSAASTSSSVQLRVLRTQVLAIIDPVETFLKRMDAMLARAKPSTVDPSLVLVPRELAVAYAHFQELVDSPNPPPTVLFAASILAALPFTTGSQQETEEKEAGTSTKHDGEVDVGLGDLTRSRDEADGARVDILRASLARLLTEVPEIMSPTLVEEMGLPFVAERTLNARWSEMLARREAEGGEGEEGEEEEEDADQLARVLAPRLDVRAVRELSAALDRVAADRSLPTVATLRDEASPWHAALRAVLGSTRLPLTSAFRWQCSMLGIGWLADEREAAVAARSAATTAASGGAGPASVKPTTLSLSSVDPATLDALRSLDTSLSSNAGALLVEQREGSFRTVSNVTAVERVEFGYTSLTAAYVDVTEDFRRLYYHPESGEVRLDGASLVDDLAHLLPNRTWDELRRGIRGKTRRLRMWLRLGTPGRTQAAVSVTSSSPLALTLAGLQAAGMLTTPTSASATTHLFKLVEWLQVELLQDFAISLEHTPWYRYPFGAAASRYAAAWFATLEASTADVGLGASLASGGFWTSTIPAIVMGSLLGQLTLLALPCRAIAGDSYDSPGLREELLLWGPPSASEDLDEWASNSLPANGTCSMARIPSTSLRLVRVPTFLALTECLLDLARAVPDAVILTISGHSTVLVRIAHGREGEREALPKALADVLARAPGASTPLPHLAVPQAAVADGPGYHHSTGVRVPVTLLIEVIVAAERANCEIMQIFDFYE